MHERYRIDVEEPGLLDRRSARWLRTRIVGLMTVESRLHAEIAPPPEEAKKE